MFSGQLPVCIVNPASAGGRTAQSWPSWKQGLLRSLGDMEFAESSCEGHGRALGRQAAESGARRIFVVGGDGTLNEVAHGVLEASACHPELALGLWPAGTGSDFARSLELPAHPDALNRLFGSKRSALMDVGRVDYLEDDRSPGYFLNVAGFALEGMVDRKIPLWKRWASGKLAYYCAALTEGVRFGTVDVRLVVGEEQEELQMPLLNAAVANGRFFGGGMRIAPDARMDDGLFDVVLLAGAPFWKAPRILKNLYRGAIQEIEGARSFSTGLLEAHPCDENPIFVGLDGEPAGRLPARFSIVPKAIRFLLPEL